MPQMDLLDIDQYILKESNSRRKYLAMEWTDTKKAYDIIPQSWMIICQEMYKIWNDIRNHGNLVSGIDSRRKKA